MYNRIYKIILYLFLSLFLMLCWYSRLATDDFYFISDVRKIGVWGSTMAEYWGWCGRFTKNYLQDVVYKYLDVNQTYYFLFPLLFLVLLIVGAQFALKNTSVYFKLKYSTSQLWLLAVSFSALLFFLSIDIGETWFWYACITTYLYSVIAFVWGIGFLFNNKHFLLSCFVILICFFYIGGASEISDSSIVFQNCFWS